jgi:Lrp/AsnC family transcriptional regulator for asnA, asnC and gidA
MALSLSRRRAAISVPLPEANTLIEAVTLLDEQDRIIIRMLQQNARASFQELAMAAGLSPSTARRRLERLTKSGALRLVAVPNWPSLGVFFIAFLSIKVDLPHLRSVAHELAMMDEICFVAIATGQCDIFAELALPHNQDFVRFITQRVAPITGIRDIQTSMIPEFIKSIEEYKIPLTPDPLYRRGGDGAYEMAEEMADVPLRSKLESG